MIAYAIAFAFPLLLFPLRFKSRLGYVLALTAGWVLFATIRLDIGGGDFFVYRSFYASIDVSHYSIPGNSWEPLFKGLAFIAKAAGLTYNGFLGLVALVGILPAVYIIEKRSGETPLGFFVYGIQWMLYGTFVILREGLAIGIGFIAIDALLDRKWIRFALAALVAFGFHYSALCILLLPFFVDEVSPRTRTWLFIAAGLAFLAVEVGTYSNLFGIFHAGIPLRLAHYLTQGRQEPLNLLNVAEVVGISILVQRYASKSPALLRNAYFLYTLFIVLALQHAIIQRMARYEEISSAFLLAAVVDPGEDRKRERSIVSMILVLYFLAKIGRWLITSANGPGGFLPFRTIF